MMLNIKEAYLNVAGINTFYHTAGDGEPLVFLHGHRADAMRWDGFIYKLAERFKVYAPDLPGYGKTQKLQRGHSMENYAEFISDFIRALNIEKPTIFGGSMGGIIGIHLAIKYPGKIKKLVLFGTPISKKYFRLSPLKYNSIKLFTQTITKFAPLRAIFQKLINSEAIWYQVLKHAVFRKIKEKEILKYEAARWRSSTIKVWAESLYDNLNVNFPEKVNKKIQIPTLAIFATGDKYIRIDETLKEYENLFKNLKIVKVEANEHLPKGPVQEEFLAHFKEAFARI